MSVGADGGGATGCSHRSRTVVDGVTLAGDHISTPLPHRLPRLVIVMTPGPISPLELSTNALAKVLGWADGMRKICEASTHANPKQPICTCTAA